jgi:hypothetical protein
VSEVQLGKGEGEKEGKAKAKEERINYSRSTVWPRPRKFHRLFVFQTLTLKWKMEKNLFGFCGLAFFGFENVETTLGLVLYHSQQIERLS